MSASVPPVARRHHTVPKFYLRGFAEGDQIRTVRLPGEQRFTQSVSDASVAKNFYSLAGHEEGDDVLEKALSEVEGGAAAVFKRITGGTWPVSYEDRMTLGYFIALQATRVPVQRRTMDHVARQMMRLRIGAGGKVGVRKQLQKSGREVTDELVERIWEQSTRPEGPPIQQSQVLHVGQMLEFAEEILKYIVGRPWHLVHFDQRSLITSDSPVSLVPDDREDNFYRGAGYMTAAQITYPLTRKFGLLMSDPTIMIEEDVSAEKTHQGSFDTRISASTVLGKFFNFYTVANASEWLFHHPADDRFVPADLPEPTLVTVAMSSESRDFDGEPWFRPSGNKLF